MIRYRGIAMDAKTSTITHAGYSRKFKRDNRNRPLMFLAFRWLILSGGLTRDEMFAHLYGDDPDGGPLDGPHVLHVKFATWRPDFDHLKLVLRVEKISGRTRYELCPDPECKETETHAHSEIPPQTGRSHVASLLRAGL